MKDPIGDRMKANYEDRTRYYLTRRTYSIIRIDGKSFHTYTRGCDKPFDLALIEDMDLTTKELCKSIEGARYAFTQSDEISILLTDFEKPTTEAWYSGNIQKLCSVSASIATANFNSFRLKRGIDKLAYFDSRVFTIPDPVEVYNYFLWRQKDAIRNSILATAQAAFSQKEIHGKSCKELVPMLLEKGVDWENFPQILKFGRFFEPTLVSDMVTYVDKRTKEEKVQEAIRTVWQVTAYDIMVGRLYFMGILPIHDNFIRVEDNDELRESDRVP